MKVFVELDNSKYEIDILNGVDISIPLDFKNNNNPTFYDTAPPNVNYYKYANKEYNLDKNGSCNVPIISFNIHCAGTHTESGNHINKECSTINNLNIPYFIPSQVISVIPKKSTLESYHVKYLEDDLYITKENLSRVIDVKSKSFNKALIIRTLPNIKSKINHNYDNFHHPYLTNDAINFIKELGFNHIVIDTPSIDRYDDNGMLGNHHIFFKNKNDSINNNTVTEFAYIPDTIIDGEYFLNLNISNFKLDAAPSRPYIYFIKKL